MQAGASGCNLVGAIFLTNSLQNPDDDVLTNFVEKCNYLELLNDSALFKIQALLTKFSLVDLVSAKFEFVYENLS